MMTIFAVLFSLLNPISNPGNPVGNCTRFNTGTYCGYKCYDEGGMLLSASTCASVNGQNSAEGYTCTDCKYGPAGNECIVSHSSASKCPW